jgi:hypothetical protein
VQREEMAAEELKQLVQDRLSALQTSLDNSEKLLAPPIYRHAPDESGCNWNWNANPYAGSPYYRPGVQMLFEELRARYNIKD